VSGSTGTRELDLLSGRIRLTPEAADAPYFFAARIAAAAQTVDPNVRVRLLLGAIAERPEDTPLRERLLAAALEAREYHVALAAYRRETAGNTEISAGLAQAHMQLGRPADALRYLRVAISQERDGDQRRVLEERLREAQQANERNIENERRQPVFRAELDQPNAVKRRLP
jgi:thioredoxin-like negative regulator of GroEL